MENPINVVDLPTKDDDFFIFPSINGCFFHGKSHKWMRTGGTPTTCRTPPLATRRDHTGTAPPPDENYPRSEPRASSRRRFRRPPDGGWCNNQWLKRAPQKHGSLNVPIEHHPTIRYMVYNGYYKVMSNIPKMGHLPTPAKSVAKPQKKYRVFCKTPG